MVIERRGVATGLITTRGFRDVLEIGRQVRPHLYDYTVRTPVPLVPRERRLEVSERIDAAGAVLHPLDEAEVAAAADALAAQGVAGDRHLLPAQLSQRRTRTARRGDRPCAPAGRLSVDLVRRAAGIPRVRAFLHHRDQRLYRPADGTLSRPLARPAGRARPDRAALHHPFQRRADVGGDGPGVSGALLPVGTGRRRGGCRGGRARGRPCQPDHLRCRRHLHRRLADRARRAGLRLQPHDRGLSGSFADGRCARDRRRRRLDRLAGRCRCAEGRAAQRGRRSGTGRLRQRAAPSRR